MSIQKNWQCLNEEGNQFFTDLAKKYFPIFKDSTVENAEDHLFLFMKEVSRFEKTSDGIDADITKEVTNELFDFCKSSLEHCNISYDSINKYYWDAYDEANNLTL